MLHKVPKLLAGAAGLFTVAVIATTVGQRLGFTGLTGNLMPGMMPLAITVAPAGTALDDMGQIGWFYEDDNSPAPDPSVWVEDGGMADGGTVGGVTGGDTGGISGGSSGGAAPTCTTRTSQKKGKLTTNGSNTLKPAGTKICTCGANGNTLKLNMHNLVIKAKENACRSLMAPACQAGCERDGTATVENQVEPVFKGETIDGGLKPCAKNQVRYCVTPPTWGCDVVQKCKAPGSTTAPAMPAPTTAPAPTMPAPASASMPSTSRYKCCTATGKSRCIQNGTSEKCFDGVSPTGDYSDLNSCMNACDPLPLPPPSTIKPAAMPASASSAPKKFYCCAAESANATCLMEGQTCPHEDNFLTSDFSEYPDATCGGQCKPVNWQCCNVGTRNAACIRIGVGDKCEDGIGRLTGNFPDIGQCNEACLSE